MFKTLFISTILLASVYCDIKDFDDKDALLLAQEKTGAFLEPPKEVYEKIHNDLAAIRKAFPVVANVHHQPHYSVGQLMCFEFTKEISTKLNASEFGPITERTMETLGSVLITFEKPYNTPALIKVLTEKGLATGCEVNHLFSGSSWITVVIDKYYVFYKGSGDCQAGCINKHYWYFRIDDGKITLVNEIGNEIETEV